MKECFQGGCLCGEVRYEAHAAPQMGGHCYCEDCRRSSGTSHCTHFVVPESAFAITGEVRFFDKVADSGNIVSRGFCPNCGSALYSRNSGMPGMAFIRASSLDNMDVLTPQVIVYAKRAPKWAKFDECLPVFGEMMEGGPQISVE
jgi:hypothetical protein